jgi:hypothetical protein
MASHKRTLLIAVALSDNWGAGYAKLCSAEGWPLEALTLVVKFNDAVLGRQGWLARLSAMRAISDAMAGDGKLDIAVAAGLLATDPSDPKECGEVAYTLRCDRDLNAIRDQAVLDICRGWDSLADGFVHDEPDPVKAGQLAAKSLKPAVDDPTPEELMVAPVIHDWEILRVSGSAYCAIRGSVTGSKRFTDKELITTSAILLEGDGWIKTKNSLYRLGAKADVRDIDEADVDAIVAGVLTVTDRGFVIGGPGVVVVSAVGGTTKSTQAKEAAAEFQDMTSRKMPLYPAPDVAKVRSALVAEFPYAVKMIDVVLSDLVGKDACRFRPTVIVGPPGCGKNRFVRRLGEVCGLYIDWFDGSGAGDNSYGGTARRWSSGEPCRPLLAIKTCGHANPLCAVDEIEKGAESNHNGSLVAALLPMLANETAKRFADPYVQIGVDLSHVSFVLTANDDSKLPATLKDRLRVLRMPALTQDHLAAVVAGVVKDLAAESGLDSRWVPDLDGDEMEICRRLLGAGSIRRLREVVGRLLIAREARAMRN